MLIHEITQMSLEQVPLVPMEEWIASQQPDVVSYLRQCKIDNKYPKEAFSAKQRKGELRFNLTPFEQTFISQLALYRNGISREKGYSNLHRDGHNRELANERIGIAGELGHAIIHDIYPYEPFLSEPHSTTEDAGDYTHRVYKNSVYVGNLHFDAKATCYSNGRLFVNPKKIPNYKINPEQAISDFCDKIHVFSFFTTDPDKSPTVTLNGYICAADLLTKPLRDFGEKGMPCFWADISELTKNIKLVYKRFF